MQKADLTQEVGRAIGRPVQSISTEDLEDQGKQWAWLGYAKKRLQRDSLLHQGQFNLDALIPTLRNLGVERLVVRLVHAPAPFSQCVGLQRTQIEQADGLSNPFGVTGLYTLSTEDIYYQRVIELVEERQERKAEPLSIRITYGYQFWDVVRQIVPLICVLILPVGLTLWMRRQAMRAQQRLADPAVVWFGYARFLNRIGLGLWLLWILATLQSGVGALIHFVLGVRSIVPWMLLPPLLLMWPPVLTLALCHAISQPVLEGVRGTGWTRAQRVRQTIWGHAAWMLPVLLGFVGIISVFAALIMMMFPTPGTRAGELWMGLPLLVLTPVTRIWSLKALIKAGGGQPQGYVLESGELHKRIAALAEQVGVKIQYIFIFATSQSRHANAFATEGNNLIFTDYLLEHFTRREVDAIVAHELIHLKSKHPIRIALLGIPVGLAAALCGKFLTDFAELWQVDFAFLIVAQGLVFFWLGQVTYSFFSRRQERAADAGAVALTGDPEAYISMLVKISQMNLLPLEWSRWNETWLTHPSAMRRIESVAQQSQLSPEELQQIMRSLDGDNPSVPLGMMSDRYELPSKNK